MRIQFKTLAIIGLIMAFTSCKSSKQTTNTNVAKRGQNNGNRPDASQIFARMDTNKDGKISKVEAKGKMQENFKIRDKNNDGFITKNEMIKRKQ